MNSRGQSQLTKAMAAAVRGKSSIFQAWDRACLHPGHWRPSPQEGASLWEEKAVRVQMGDFAGQSMVGAVHLL